MDDYSLLQEYRLNQSDAAFAELVKRHLEFVYCTALRLTREAHAAEDVTQTVFIQLARKAGTINNGHALVGWLYRATQRTFLMNRRQEVRRRRREWEALLLADQNHSPVSQWEQVAPILDEALRRLNRVEQDAILLHYFQGKAYHEVAVMLGVNKSAAHKRVARALEKLRVHFSRRGVTATAATLASVLSARGAEVALPAGLGAKISTASLAGASATGGIFSVLGKLFHHTVNNRAVLGAATMATVAAIPLGLQYQSIKNLQGQLTQKNRLVVPAISSAGGSALMLNGRLAHFRKLIDYAVSLNSDQLKALLENMLAQPPRREDADELPVYVSHLVDLDPQAAFTWANALPGGSVRNSILAALVRAWSYVDPIAAFQAMDEVEDVTLRDDLRQDAVEYMVNMDPKKMLAVISSLGPTEQTEHVYSEFFIAWAAHDPAAAAAAALDLPHTHNRIFAISFMVMGWAETDPQAAVYWADAHLEVVQDNTLSKAVEYLAQRNPAAAVKYVTGLADAAKRDALTAVVAAKWGEQDPLAALFWVEGFANGQVRDAAVKGLVMQYSQVDPPAAEKLLAKIPAGPMRDEATLAVGYNWEKQDMLAALSWARSLPVVAGEKNDPRPTLLMDIIHTWAGVDPVATAKYIQANLPGDPDYTRIIQTFASTWQNGDPQAAFAWAQSLPMDANGRGARRAVITQYATRDPKAAWDLTLQLPDELRDQTLINVLAKWGPKNPAQAAAALATAKFGQAHVNIATQALAETWCKQDPTAASQWVDTLPQGTARDKAVGKLIEIEGKNNPPAAFKWAETIGNDTNRLQQMTLVITPWAKTQPSEALAAVEAAKLTDEEHAALLALILPATPAGKQ